MPVFPKLFTIFIYPRLFHVDDRVASVALLQNQIGEAGQLTSRVSSFERHFGLDLGDLGSGHLLPKLKK